MLYRVIMPLFNFQSDAEKARAARLWLEELEAKVKKESLNDLSREASRYTEYIVVGGKRHKLFDFPTEFVERLKAKGKVRRMSWSEIMDEYKEYQKEKGMTNG